MYLWWSEQGESGNCGVNGEKKIMKFIHIFMNINMNKFFRVPLLLETETIEVWTLKQHKRTLLWSLVLDRTAFFSFSFTYKHFITRNILFSELWTSSCTEQRPRQILYWRLVHHFKRMYLMYLLNAVVIRTSKAILFYSGFCGFFCRFVLRFLLRAGFTRFYTIFSAVLSGVLQLVFYVHFFVPNVLWEFQRAFQIQASLLISTVLNVFFVFRTIFFTFRASFPSFWATFGIERSLNDFLII